MIVVKKMFLVMEQMKVIKSYVLFLCILFYSLHVYFSCLCLRFAQDAPFLFIISRLKEIYLD